MCSKIGIIDMATVTAANVSDVATTPEFLTGEEEAVYAHSGYPGAEKHADAIR